MRAFSCAPSASSSRSASAPPLPKESFSTRKAACARPRRRRVCCSARMERDMGRRNASVAVIGAGDYIGAAIARKFAGEGFVVFAGRRDGEKLVPLIAEIEAGGGRITGRSLDARKEEEIAAFLRDADAVAPLEIGI